MRKKKEYPEDGMTDEMILKYIRLAQLNDQSAYKILIDYFEKDIRGMRTKNKLWVPGFEDEDIHQECRIMVIKAIKNFDPNKTKNVGGTVVEIFRHLIFKMCKARIVTLIQESNRLKKKTLNKSESLDVCFEDSYGNEYSNYDKIASDDEKVVDMLARKEREDLLRKKIYSYLTDLEKNVFNLMMDDYSYSEMSKILNIDEKSIDNAIQRARKKIKANRAPILISGCVEFTQDQIKKSSNKNRRARSKKQ